MVLLLSLDGGGRDVHDGHGGHDGHFHGHCECCDDGDSDGDDCVYGDGGDGGFGLGNESGSESVVASGCLGLGDDSLGDGCPVPLGAIRMRFFFFFVVCRISSLYLL